MFHVGLPAWKKSNGLVISESAGLEAMIKENTSYVLIDLRAPGLAETGFIKGAVSIPAGELAGAKDRFPAIKTAPIILADAAQASNEAFNIVRSWGYSNTSVLRGGTGAWKGELVKGKPGTRVEYVKRLKPGEIAIDEFKTIVAGKPNNAVVLDVREGVTEGVIAGAIAVPRNELANRLGELPKDKEIVIHCNTGILAKMAYDTLKEKGFANVRYLNAIIQVAKNGSFEINEK